MKNLKHINCSRGYTLIELLVYISLIGTLLTSLSLFFVTIINARVKSQSVNEVNHQGAAMMDYMTQTIRNAKSIGGSSVSTAVMGYDVDGGSTDSGDNNVMNGSTFTAPLSGTIATLYARIGPTISASPNDKGQMAIYKDVNGIPGQLLANSAAVALVASSWVAFPITATNLVAGQTYWIVYNANGLVVGANDLRYHATTNFTAQTKFLAQTYGTWPATWSGPGTSVDNREFSIYAKYTTAFSASPASLSLSVVDSTLSPTVFTMNNTGSPAAGTFTMGLNTDMGTDDVRVVDAMETMSVVAPASGNITTLNAMLGQVDTAPNDKGQMAIYSSGTNGMPATKLANSSTITLSPNAWNAFPISSVSVTEGQTYWLAFETNSQSNTRGVLRERTAFSGKSRSLNSQVFVTWPATAWGGYADVNEYSMYASVSSTAGGPVAGNLYVKEGTGAYVALNDSKVQVSNVSFKNVTSGSTPGAVQVSFTLSRLNPNNKEQYNYQKTFTSTAAIRSGNTSTGTPVTVTHIQSTGSTNDAGALNITQIYGSSVTAGNLLVVSVAWDTYLDQKGLACTDSFGNAYTTVNIWDDQTNEQALGICYAVNGTTGASNTVTATFTGSAGFRRIIVSEYSGINPANPYDASVGRGGILATTAANAVTTGNALTSQAGDLIYGAVMDTDSTATIAAGTGFTQRASVNAKDLAVQDLQQAAAGSIASTQTFGTAHRYDAALVAFKAIIQ